MYISLRAITNPGDEVLIATPTFPLYSSVTTLLGSTPVEIDTSADNFVLTPARLKQVLKEHPNAKGLVLNYPSNPTGVTYTHDQVKALAETIKDTNLVVIADEIYSELVYNGRHTSIAEFIPDQTLVLNGASKSHAMTGFSLGQSDMLRRAMGHKEPEILQKNRDTFVTGAVKNGVDEKTANYVFDLMVHFAGYGFNKSHMHGLYLE